MNRKHEDGDGHIGTVSEYRNEQGILDFSTLAEALLPRLFTSIRIMLPASKDVYMISLEKSVVRVELLITKQRLWYMFNLHIT